MTRHRGTKAAILSAALFGIAGAAYADGFAPGAWSHQTDMVSADVPGFPEWLIKMTKGHQTRKSCYTQSDIQTRPEALLTQDDAAVCHKRRFSLVGGKFVYDTFCTNSTFPDGLLIASTGTYTANSYTISTVSTGMRKGKPARIVTTGTGQRTGSCK